MNDVWGKIFDNSHKFYVHVLPSAVPSHEFAHARVCLNCVLTMGLLACFEHTTSNRWHSSGCRIPQTNFPAWRWALIHFAIFFSQVVIGCTDTIAELAWLLLLCAKPVFPMCRHANAVAVPLCNKIWKHTCHYNKIIEKFRPYSIHRLKILRFVLLLILYEIFSFILMKSLAHIIPQRFSAAFIEPHGRELKDAVVKNHTLEWVKMKCWSGS